MTASALATLRAEVLANAERATRGDELAAVSAMVTATETEALRRVAGAVDADVQPPDVDKSVLAAVFAARRRLGLEPGATVFGPSDRSGGPSSAPASTGPDTNEALADVGYSELGWESAEKSAAPESDATLPRARRPAHPPLASQLADAASQPAPRPILRAAFKTQTQTQSQTPAGGPGSMGALATPSTAASTGIRSGDGRGDERREGRGDGDADADADAGLDETDPPVDPAEEDADEEDADEEDADEEDAEDWMVGGTQAAPGDFAVEEDGEEEEEEDDDDELVGGTQAAPGETIPTEEAEAEEAEAEEAEAAEGAEAEEAETAEGAEAEEAEAETVRPSADAASSPAARARPGFLRVAAKAARSPFKPPVPAPARDREDEEDDRAGVSAGDRGGIPSVAARAGASPACTPADVICSYVPSTFPNSRRFELAATESSLGGFAPAEVLAVAERAAEEASRVPATEHEEVPLTAPDGSAAAPRSTGPGGGALAAALLARSRRAELAGAVGASLSLSLGPPRLDEAEAEAEARGRAVGRGGRSPSAKSPRSPRARELLPEIPAAPAAPAASSDSARPVASMTSNVTDTQAAAGSRAGGATGAPDAFTPFDLTEIQTEVQADAAPPTEAAPGGAASPAKRSWAGGWGKVASDRRGDRGAPPTDADAEDTGAAGPDPDPESEAAPESGGAFLVASPRRVRDVVERAAAMAPPPPRRLAGGAKDTADPGADDPVPPPGRESTGTRVQRLWDEHEASESAALERRRSARERRPARRVGDSQFQFHSQPSQPTQTPTEDAAASDRSDASEASDPSDASEKSSDPSDASQTSDRSDASASDPDPTPLATRRERRERKPRRFFGDSQFPSQDAEEADEDDAVDGEDVLVDEAVLAGGGEAASESEGEPWYAGGTQAFPEAPPPDEDSDDSEEGDEEDDGESEESEEEVDAEPRQRSRGNPNWRGPVPELGCPKCRYSRGGCGRCRAIRDHAQNGTPLAFRVRQPWKGYATRGPRRKATPKRTTEAVAKKRPKKQPKKRSTSAKRLPAATPRAVSATPRRVRFDDDDGGARAAAPGGRLTSEAPASALARAKHRPRLLAPPPGSSGRKRGRPRLHAAEETAARPSPPSALGAALAKRRRRTGKASARDRTVFAGVTFLLSSLESKADVEALTLAIEGAGGTVARDVPPPEAPTTPAAMDEEDAYAPSQDVGAPMTTKTRRLALETMVVTPKPGRTLKCLFAAAIKAPVLTPEWVLASIDAGRALSPASSPRGAVLSRGVGMRGEEDDEEDDDQPGSEFGLFDGKVVSLSGDDRYVEQFGVLLRHAGAEVLSAKELADEPGEDVPEGEGPCDVLLAQAPPGGGGAGVPSYLARAAKRLGVPCLRHEWAVESLLKGRLEPIRAYRVR